MAGETKEGTADQGKERSFNKKELAEIENIVRTQVDARVLESLSNPALKSALLEMVKANGWDLNKLKADPKTLKDHFMRALRVAVPVAVGVGIGYYAAKKFQKGTVLMEDEALRKNGSASKPVHAIGTR